MCTRVVRICTLYTNNYKITTSLKKNHNFIVRFENFENPKTFFFFRNLIYFQLHTQHQLIYIVACKIMSQLADIVHSEVDAARIELDNQSSQIQDRLSELHYRMEELLSKSRPENDGLAFESAMAITGTSNVDVRGALQWHLAEVSRNNFQKDADSEVGDGKNVLSRADLEQKIDNSNACLSLTERRLEELQSTTEAEYNVIMVDVHDLTTLVETSPLTSTADKGPGIYLPSTQLKSVPGLRPRSRDQIENFRAELGKLHQLFLTKTATMSNENIQLQKDNEGMRRELEALRAAIARPIEVSNNGSTSTYDGNSNNNSNNSKKSNNSSNNSNNSNSSGGSRSSRSDDGRSIPSYNEHANNMYNNTTEEDPMLTFAMDNIMRVMILARIPPDNANKVYEQLLEFTSEWTQRDFLRSCESCGSFTKAIKQTGFFAPTKQIQSALGRDKFFEKFRKKNNKNEIETESVEVNEISEQEKKEAFVNNVVNIDSISNTSNNSSSSEMNNDESLIGTSSPKREPSSERKERRRRNSKNKPSRDKNGKRKNKPSNSSSSPRVGISASMISTAPSMSEELVLSNHPTDASEIQIGSVVHVKMPSWRQAHKGSIIKIWANGSFDVELSDGQIAKGLGSSALKFGL